MKTLLKNIDLNEAFLGNSNIGLVPTMGSLHEGHISLIKKSLKLSNKTIVSIFVNPKQFNNKKDYIKYPRNIKKDLKILKKLKVDFVYLPKIKDIYKSKNKIKIKLNKEDKILCAKFRKGHFEGVIEVMTRLTKIVNPSKIFMGEKDFQQLLLVKRYVEKNFKSKIISCKTIRDKNKLALSSRNILLNQKNLNKAGRLAKDLIIFKKKLLKKKNLKDLIFMKKNELKKKYDIKIDYLELRNAKNLKLTNKITNAKIFIAYYINRVRLIDNY
ncbi:pantoate--beta-alanine ligase [Candidatus Pelagibacter sp.]|nr:pantoate--beta-alanine ligase [Candidatus Pelagibacter sp.]